MLEIIFAMGVVNASYLLIIAVMAMELKRAKNQALTDVLTGLPNRVLLLDRLVMCIAGAKRNKTDLSLMFIDLNGFKEVNDRFGHGEGDRALTTVAERIQSCIRSSDTLARLGGDEFVLIMQTKDEQDIVRKAEQIAREVSKPIDGIEAKIGISVGVSFFREHSEDPIELLTFADEAMYMAKKMGKQNRNQSALVFYKGKKLDNAE